MNVRAMVWLVAGIALWSLALVVGWVWRATPGIELVAVTMSGSAGLMIGRAVCFPHLETWL